MNSELLRIGGAILAPIIKSRHPCKGVAIEKTPNLGNKSLPFYGPWWFVSYIINDSIHASFERICDSSRDGL